MKNNAERSEKKPISVTKLSANWNNSSKAEGFYWNLNNVSGNRNRNISGQLVNALKNTHLHSGGCSSFECNNAINPDYRATWQKIKILKRLY